MRTRTRGIQLADDGSRTVDKDYKGQRIFQRLGAVNQNDAEAWLSARQAEIDAQRANALRRGGQRLWADAARKYLMECQTRKVRTLDLISFHVQLLLPYIGALPLRLVCNESLEQFKLERQEEGRKNSTINRSLEVVRSTLIRAARVWREDGEPWLTVPPLIEMLDERAQKREPYPITWAEQSKLLQRLPGHLQRMVEFAVNTGARDENVCGLRWSWEVPVPELKRSVFVIPPEFFKVNRKHVLILNDAAWSIVEARRGVHKEYVFTYAAPGHEPGRVDTMNSAAFQKARADVGLPMVRVHDLRHTFGQRLRDAGVQEEDRALLLGHAIEGMPRHYATATVARLVDAANSVSHTRDRTTLLRVVNG
jgi:integrase